MFFHGPLLRTSSAAQRVEGLSPGVVVGVAAGADRGDRSNRGDRASLGEALGVPNGEVFCPPCPSDD
jgi:hypothetical protein